MIIGLDGRLAARGLGISTFVRNLAAGLVQAGVDLVWFGDPALAPEGVADTRALGRAPYPFLDTAWGRRVVGATRVDLFHLTGNTGWGRRGPVPTVLTVHDLIFTHTGFERRSARQLLGHAYMRRNVAHAVANADRTAVPSRVTYESLMSLLRPAVPPEVIPLGVEIPPDPGEIFNGEPYVVAFSGRDPRKNITLLLQSIRLPEWPSLRLRILGGAGLPAGFEQEAGPELADGTIEVVGYRPRDELWQILRSARALVFPSLSEGFGLPVLEAFAVETPVVTGLADVTREIGGEAAITIDQTAPARSIAQALRTLEADPDYRQHVVARGLQRAKRFTWRQTTERYLSLYEETLA